jgi:hypothetical protein
VSEGWRSADARLAPSLSLALGRRSRMLPLAQLRREEIANLPLRRRGPSLQTFQVEISIFGLANTRRLLARAQVAVLAALVCTWEEFQCICVGGKKLCFELD